MKITPARREDVAAINEILNHSIRTTTANWSWKERSMEDAYRWFDQHDCNGYYPLYVMRHDGQVVGYGSLSPFRNKKGYWPVAENSVYVHKDYQRKGIGKALLKMLIDHAKTSGLRVITAWIDSSNKNSIRFHEQFGFYLVGEMKDIGEKWGTRCSVTIMQLDVVN